MRPDKGHRDCARGRHGLVLILRTQRKGAGVPLTRKIYTREFKELSVKLNYVSGKSVAETASDMGLPVNMLHRWRPFQLPHLPLTIHSLRRTHKYSRLTAGIKGAK